MYVYMLKNDENKFLYTSLTISEIELIFIENKALKILVYSCFFRRDLITFVSFPKEKI